ncbi:MAG: C25 family cysteine peptidase, partial [Caldilineaceae bacterium]
MASPIPRQRLRERLLSYTLVMALVLSALLSALPAGAASAVAAPVASSPTRSLQATAACTRITGEAQVPSRTVLHFDELANGFTLGNHYQAAHGVVFEDNQTTKALIYSDHPNDVGKSFTKPNVATNSAQSPNTSQNVPMVITFDADQAYVGLRPGNGKDSAGNGPDLGGILRAYDRAGNLLCTETFSPVPASHPRFIGVYDSAKRIAKVELDYGDTLLSESIDNLTFSEDKNPPVQPGSCVELFNERQIPGRVLVNFDDLKDAVTIGEHYVPAHGLHFMDATNTRVITYGDRSADPTTARSAPNVAANDAVHPSTSANVPLTFSFDKPKAHVGFYMGNGETANLPGAMVGYDAAGNVICQVTNTPVPEAYTEFIGMYDSAGRIARVTLNYGDTTLSESIDDLYFSDNTAPPVEPTEATPPSYDPPKRPLINRDEFVRLDKGQNDNKGFQGVFRFPEAHFQKLIGPDQQEFGQVGVPGIDQAGMQPGLPNVPIYTQLIAVPVGSVLMLDKSTPKLRQINSVLLAPVQPEPADVDTSQEKDPFPIDDFRDRPFAFDKEAYASGKTFPENPVEIHQLGTMRDLELWQVSVAAGQYDTAKKELRLFESIDLSLRFEGGKGFFRTERDLNPFNKQKTGIEGLVMNYEILDKFILPGDITQWLCIGTEYLIITDPAFRTAADTLATWKRAKGISTAVVETGSDANDAGNSAVEIKAYIEKKYDDCLIRPSYVLLLGDAEHIPPWYNRVITWDDNGTATTSDDFADTPGSDLEYSLMDSSDILPDLALGRIPVDTLADAETVINKIVNYEQNPPNQHSFYSNMAFAAYFQCCDDDAANDGTAVRSFTETAELVRDEMTSKGYSVERIYTSDDDYHDDPTKSGYYNAGTRDITPDYYNNGARLPSDLRKGSGFAWDGDTNDVIDAFNEGNFLIFHRDHGSITRWGDPSFSTSNFASLTNGNLTPVVYSINCATGLFDNETRSAANDDYSYSTSSGGVYWAESLLRQEDGAVGIIGDVRNSPTWANSALSRGLFDATWPGTVPEGGSDSITRLGDILNYGKSYLWGQIGVAQTAGSVSTNSATMDVILYHVYGDPTMEMWTKDPHKFWLGGIIVIEEFNPIGWRVRYPVNGATLTALQDGKPIGRAMVQDGKADVHFVNKPEQGKPVQWSASLPGAVSVQLRTEDQTNVEQPHFNRKDQVVVETVHSDNKGFAAKIQFPPLQYWPVKGGDGNQYIQLGISGLEPNTAPIGQPDVPVYRRLLAVPRGAQVILQTPKIEAGYTISWTDLLVSSAQPSPVDSGLVDGNHPGDPPHDKGEPDPSVFDDPAWAFDEKAYASQALFPAEPVRIQKVGRMRDLDLVQIEMAAGQYDTASRRYISYTGLEFRVQFEGGEGIFLPGDYRNPFESGKASYAQVINWQAVPKYVGDWKIVGPIVCLGAELIIITDPAFRSAADTLADWKRTSGISTLVVETGAGKAGTTKEEIQDYIRNKYNNCLVRPSYVDLIGDAEHIPPFYRATAYTAAAGTDLDYSLMDNADLMPDLALGRIPVDTLAEAEAVVNKIVAYEKNPPMFILPNASYYNTMTFASYFQCCKDGASAGTDARAYVETSEFVRDELKSSYTVERIYTTNAGASDTPNYYYNGATLPAALNAASGYAWDGDTTDIIDAINAGRMLVYHRDHGSSSGWAQPSFKASNLGSLTNGSRTPVVYSINCSTGYFDNETDGSGASGSYFAEQILKLAEGGAAGVFAASRVSPTWANNALTRGLFDATWTDVVPGYGTGTSITRLGDILNYGKAYMVSQIGVAQTAGSVSSSASDTNLIIYHLFGDATMEMHTGNPYRIVLPFEAIPERVGPKLWNLKYPVEGAVITALQDGRPLARGTVEKGVASLRFLADRNPDRPVQFSADMPGAIPVQLRVKQNSGDVTPEQGGTVQDPEKKVVVEFPPNAVDQNVEIVHTELVSPTVDVPAGKTPLRSFLLDASDGEGNAVHQFKDFYVLKVCFSDEELKELGDLSQLELAFYDEEKQEWVSVETKVDESGKCLFIKLDHFTEFAVLGNAELTAPTSQIFLPAVQ